MLRMTKMPKVLDAVQGQYAVVRVEAEVNRTDDLTTLGQDIARDHNINRARIQVVPLVDPGNVYLIAVTKPYSY